MTKPAKDPLAIYVHWPFCARICPYCDFNVYKGAQDEDLSSAIVADLHHWRDWSGPRKVTSIHFGGGTPSLMRAENVEAVIKAVDALWDLSSSAEIGLEANPGDQDQSRWQGFAAAGVNRLSLGVQSFDDRTLKFLGRDHSGKDAKEACHLAQEIFPNVSLDLIFGVAGFDGSKDLSTAIELGPQHLSTYQLTIEEGTAFHRAEQRGQARAVNSDSSAVIFENIQAGLSAAGYSRYEVSNWSRPGFESRHNLAYWRGQDYVGVGPGAHGRLTSSGIRYATTAHMKPGLYKTQVKDGGTGIEDKEILSRQDWAAEYLMMGLRISEGISIAEYESLSGAPLPSQSIISLTSDDYLSLENDRLFATEKGRAVLDHITGQLLA